MAEHDASYILQAAVFSSRDVADLIRGFVDGDWTRDLDLRSLERVREIGVSNVIELQEMHDMLAERVKTWTEEWKAEGLREGLREGRKEGEVKLLRQLLMRRFGEPPAWVGERLRGASETELEVWADKVLDAESLDEVFADHQ
jgi:hypothetical protein